MARKIKVQPASQESLDGLIAKFDRFAINVERRFSQTASQESLNELKATVDRHTAVLDHISGELKGLQDSRTLLGAMYKDHGRTLDAHDRRLSALESRQAPPAP